MDGWMDGQMDGWTEACMDAGMDRWVGRCSYLGGGEPGRVLKKGRAGERGQRGHGQVGSV